MGVLACAGFEWGVENLTHTHIDLMRQRQKEFVEALRSGNVLAAGAAGADFSTIVILASGNRELQSMVDLVVARTMRILAMAPESDLSSTWIKGHDEILELLEAGDTQGALARYRQIYVDYRRRRGCPLRIARPPAISRVVSAGWRSSGSPGHAGAATGSRRLLAASANRLSYATNHVNAGRRASAVAR
jgi:hypothetical protein